MIIKKYFRTREDGVNLYRTYSDADMKIRKVGTEEVYDEAIDIEGSQYTYTETDRDIEGVTDEITDSEALAIIRGEAE